MSVFNEMICSQLASWLKDEIEDLENKELNGAGTFFALASRQLNDDDFKKLVRAARSELKRLQNRAKGCPTAIRDWRFHYENEENSI